MNMFRFFASAAVLVLSAQAVFAAPASTFMISGMEPANVMRFRDPQTDRLRIGWIQSTQFSRVVDDARSEAVEEGMLYYSVMFEKADDGTFRMEISYDFAAPDGSSKGIRSTSIVTQETFRAITPDELGERAQAHAGEFSKVIYENFLKDKIAAADFEGLGAFIASITRDLLKTLPKDGIMILRRWDDLAGRPAAAS